MYTSSRIPIFVNETAIDKAIIKSIWQFIGFFFDDKNHNDNIATEFKLLVLALNKLLISYRYRVSRSLGMETWYDSQQLIGQINGFLSMKTFRNVNMSSTLNFSPREKTSTNLIFKCVEYHENARFM